MERITLIFPNFGPLHVARLQEVINLGEKKGVEVSGIELASRQKIYPWKTPDEKSHTTTIFNEKAFEDVSAWEYYRQVWQTLDRLKPDAVAMAGYDRPPFHAALAWVRFRGKIAILMSDSNYHDQKRNRLKEWMKSFIVRRFDSALVAGKPSKQYASSLGINDNLIFVGLDVVDNDYFAKGADAIRKEEGLNREQLGLQRPYFLSVCRFIWEKNLLNLIKAYRHYRERSPMPPWDLVLCGSGPLEGELKEAASDIPGIHFPGFVQADKTPAYYGLANVFILSSIRETWGLVVNEAMASGLPVIVSKVCGCAPDLVQDGANGFSFDPYDVEGLALLMAKMSSGEMELRTMGEASKRIIANWTLEVFAENLFKAFYESKAPAVNLSFNS
jgi:1,2-diacylglycerol 3-alpha-glucosyltransferase